MPRATIVLVLLATMGASPVAAPPPYRIAAMRASLFYSDTGTFSENILDNPHFTLWNTIIGEGSARGPSEATLVVVEIAGAPGAHAEGRTLQFIATSRDTTMVRRRSPIGILSAKGRYFAGFWLHGTGCRRITLSATITGQSPVSRMTKVIPFACGE